MNDDFIAYVRNNAEAKATNEKCGSLGLDKQSSNALNKYCCSFSSDVQIASKDFISNMHVDYRLEESCNKTNGRTNWEGRKDKDYK